MALFGGGALVAIAMRLYRGDSGESEEAAPRDRKEEDALRKSKLLDYDDIFNHRGDEYHRAMTLSPSARDLEFEAAAHTAGTIKEGEIVVDLPSGGGYLRGHLERLHPGVKFDYRPMETSKTFASFDGQTKTCEWTSLGLPDESVDVFVCCAALHHVDPPKRKLFFAEALRCLKPGGRLAILDVEPGSVQSVFLNYFVNRYNTMGHVGVWINKGDEAALAETGFQVESTIREYPWSYTSKEDGLSFCRLLFGLNLMGMELLEHVLTTLFDLREEGGGYVMDWALRSITATKPHHAPPTP